MKLARFLYRNHVRYGIVGPDGIVALDQCAGTFSNLLANSRTSVLESDICIPANEIVWLPPFTSEAKIICVGFNYASHDSEDHRRAGEYPTLFVRFPDSFVGSGNPVVTEADSRTLDWEGELALVIGQGGRRIPVDDAWNHIAGFTPMAENSERIWQTHSAQATAGKNWFASGACGPWVTTVDEAGRGPFELTTRLNGHVVQQASTSSLLFNFASLVSYVSTFTPLRPGDVIATGTPAGSGYRQNPPRFLEPGDELEVSVPGVGTLRHSVTTGPGNIVTANDISWQQSTR
ncbi:fumarylacetoacetate hydrolase family protein [Nocardia sp. NPDC051900]|uniref:fumarylacetoacetate hydrolase family protein n=1 Tax=Nocardia sp. NPDC051900 TaxID=3364326 RepID=UPI0037B3AF07